MKFFKKLHARLVECNGQKPYSKSDNVWLALIDSIIRLKMACFITPEKKLKTCAKALKVVCCTKFKNLAGISSKPQEFADLIDETICFLFQKR